MGEIVCINLLFSVLISTPVLADGVPNANNSSRITTQTRGSGGGTLTDGGDGTTRSQEPIGPQGEDLGATQGYQETGLGGLTSANSSKSQGNMTQILGLAMGAGFARICPTLHGSWACPLAAMSFADALSAGRAAGNAGYTAIQLDPNTGAPLPAPGNVDDSPFNQQAIDGLAELSSMGYTVNADGSIATPKGQSVNAGSYGSAAALGAQGFTPDQVQKIMSQMQDIQNKSAQAAGVDPSALQGQAVAGTTAPANSGGSVSGAAIRGGDIWEEEVIRIGQPNKKNEDRMPASQAAKLKKNFNGTPIGIGMANIFLIVQQKYDEKKEKKTEFIHREY